jgi:hypothetical protein
MGLASHAIALGIGYVLGHPDGRERARKVPAQVRQLAARPEAARLTEKGKALAGQAVQTTKQRLGRSTADATGQAGSGTPATGGTVTESAARRRLFVRPRRRPGGIDTREPGAHGVVVTESSGDPAVDARSARIGDPDVAERTDAAMHGTLPPAGKPTP